MAEADGHPFVSGSRLIPIGAENPVPPGQVKSEIAVGFPNDHRMMHPVHFRGHHEKTEHSINRLRQTHVAVIEQACRIQENLKENYGQRGNPQNKNRPHLDGHGKENLQGVETNPGRCVEIEICVVHHVQAPKGWEGMKNGMLKIDDEIKKHYSDKYCQPIGYYVLVQESPTAALIQGSDVNCRNWENQT